MNEKQHTVPVVYLKNFTNENGQIYSTEFIEHIGKWAPPKPKDPRQICYFTNFYNLNDGQQKSYNQDARILEKEAFKKYENKYIDELLSLIETRNLLNSHIYDIAEFYASMKLRGINFRKRYTPEILDANLRKIAPIIKQEIVDFLTGHNILKFNIDDIYQRLSEQIIDNHDQQRFQTDALLTTVKGINETIGDAIERLKMYDLKIYLSNSPNSYFITNDCPGFSVTNQNKIADTQFMNDLFHFMPLSPTIGFALVKCNFSLFKKERVKYIYLSADEVNYLNWLTRENRNKNIYSHSANHLKS